MAVRGAEESRIQGIGVSPGIAHGPLFIISRDEPVAPRREIREGDLPGELRRLEKAIQLTREQLLEIQRDTAARLGGAEAGVFEAHLLVLEDATLLGAVHKQLEMSRHNVESVYAHVIRRYSDALENVPDSYLRERAADVRDVGRRVLRNLMGTEDRPFAGITAPCVVAAHDLAPSDTARLPRDLVLGFVTYAGSKTSHTAIMARSMDIPAVVGIHPDPSHLEEGTQVIVDGYGGLLILHPSPATVASFGAIETRHEQVEESLEALRATPAVTTDGRRVVLSANIEMLEDLPWVLESGAEGIGLFRSEFLFTGRRDAPEEEEQYQAYVKAARAVAPNHVVLRTLDIGGDKFLDRMQEESEANPFLGLRAIRFCLVHKPLFRVQLRAMLRASVEGNVRIMYPMVSGIDEVRLANRLLEEERARLLGEGVRVPEALEIGVMIEVPSAAMTAEILAEEADFFSIGTNDLIQYSIAIDRGNELLAHLYQPTHPGILRLIQRTIEAGHAAGISVSVCGEMAGEITLVPLLLGMGVDELSTGAALVPRIKKVVRSVAHSEMRKLAEELLANPSGEAIQEKLAAFAKERFGDLLD